MNDEPFQLFSFQLQLETKFLVEVAENGFKALQEVTNHPKDYFDAIILDLNMPIMDGYNACNRIFNHLNEIEGNISS